MGFGFLELSRRLSSRILLLRTMSKIFRLPLFQKTPMNFAASFHMESKFSLLMHLILWNTMPTFRPNFDCKQNCGTRQSCSTYCKQNCGTRQSCSMYGKQNYSTWQSYSTYCKQNCSQREQNIYQSGIYQKKV